MKAQDIADAFLHREMSVEALLPWTGTYVGPPALNEETREIRVQLADGQTFPKDVHRGRPVEFRMEVGPTTFLFRGRVKFRRLGVMVVAGDFDRD